MEIHFVTGNAGKFKEVQLILSNWSLVQHPLDLPELQGDSEEVAIAKAKEALKVIGKPVIVDDTNIRCPAIKGLPGPYAKDFLRHLGDTGFADLIHRYDDHSIQAISYAVYAAPGEEPVVFKGVLNGTVVEPRGELKHGKYSFNGLFVPEGYTQTMGEISMEEHSAISHRSKAFKQLAEYLQQRHPQETTLNP